MGRADRIKGKFEHYGVLVIPIKLNGVRLEFMVDTGASFCAVSKRVAPRIGLAIDTTDTFPMATASGSLIQVPLVKVKSVSVGINKINNISVVILDFPTELRIHGLLGMNFLRNFRFTIEPDTTTLVLRKIPKS